jgi:hypothetical protein
VQECRWWRSGSLQAVGPRLGEGSEQNEMARALVQSLYAQEMVTEYWG